MYVKEFATMMTRTKNVLSFAFAGLLFSGAVVLAADPPAKDEAVVPWTRKATKDMTPNRKQGPNEQKSIGTSDAAIYFIAPKTTVNPATTLPLQYAESPRTRMFSAWAPAATAVLMPSVSMTNTWCSRALRSSTRACWA